MIQVLIPTFEGARASVLETQNVRLRAQALAETDPESAKRCRAYEDACETERKARAILARLPQQAREVFAWRLRVLANRRRPRPPSPDGSPRVATSAA